MCPVKAMVSLFLKQRRKLGIDTVEVAMLTSAKRNRQGNGCCSVSVVVWYRLSKGKAQRADDLRPVGIVVEFLQMICVCNAKG